MVADWALVAGQAWLGVGLVVIVHQAWVDDQTWHGVNEADMIEAGLRIDLTDLVALAVVNVETSDTEICS